MSDINGRLRQASVCRLGSLSIVFCVFLGMDATAGIIIDDFDVDNPALLEVDSGPGGFPSSAATSASDSAILGGKRDTSVLATGTPASNAVSTVDVFGGVLDVNNGTDAGNDANSTTTLVWDGTSGLPADFSADNYFSIDVLALDTTAYLKLDLIDSSNNTTTLTKTVISTGPSYSTTVEFAFADFSPGSPSSFSFSSVKTIALTLTGAPAFDITLDNFESAIPEPSTFALLGVVCVGLGIYHGRRRKRSKRAQLADKEAETA